MKTLTIMLLAGLSILFPNVSVMAMEDRSRREVLTIQGTVEKLPLGLYGSWIIDGRRVLVTPYTQVDQNHSLAGPGSLAEIDGLFRGNTFQATAVRIRSDSKAMTIDQAANSRKKVSFHGTIVELPRAGIGHWKIDDHRVMVDKLTRIEETLGEVIVGALVKVNGYYRNQTFYADWVRVK